MTTLILSSMLFAFRATDTPPISRDTYRVFIFFEKGDLRKDTTTRGWRQNLGGLAGLQPLREKAIEYVVLSKWFDRSQAEQDKY